MKLQQRIQILKELGDYMLSDEPAWIAAKAAASRANGWFIPSFVDAAVNGIANNFLNENRLRLWLAGYPVKDSPQPVKTVGVVMAGNIPLVGFHDFLCVFLSGHYQKIKLSAKDSILMKHLADHLFSLDASLASRFVFSELLKNCDAYIATGSNNSARYFEQYFGKYPHIIRRNRTSVAILDSSETPEELDLLADDIQLYFGLGCRNVTQVYVPEEYDFVPLLSALKKYDFLIEDHKYKNNFDYNLALPLINHQFYMTNSSLLLIESPSPFSPIAQLHYQFYSDKDKLTANLPLDQIQCIVGHGHIPFGKAQQPELSDYADGIDTMAFVCTL
jgi:hypothetical protein